MASRALDPATNACAPTAQLRRLLEDRFAQLTTEAEGLFAEFRDQGRSQLAEQLNQAVRRLRQSRDPEDLAVTLMDVAVDAAGPFAGGAALFRVQDGVAKGQRIRGVSEEAADAFPAIAVPLSGAAALAGAVESRDPVIAVSSASQVSQPLMEFLGHAPEGRVWIYPIVVREQVPALVYAWGAVNGAIMELLAQVAAAVWIEIDAPAPVTVAQPPADLVQIAATPVPIAAAPAPKSSWDALAPEEQQIHLRAQRFARVQVAEMRLYEAEAVQSGRAKRNLYDGLRKPINQARKEFHESFYTRCPSMVDYLHLELVRTLANDDPELLGKDYPGPLA